MRSEEMVHFNIKVPEELKEAFIEACKAQDSNASREVREFMRKYIAKHGQKELKL